MVEATEDIDEHDLGKGRREKRPFSKYCPLPPPHVYSSVHSTRYTLQGTRKTRPSLNGHTDIMYIVHLNS